MRDHRPNLRDRRSTSHIGKVLGISSSRVLKIARERKDSRGRSLTEVLSIKIDNRRWWLPSSIKRLKPGPWGRPSGGGK